MTRSALDTLDGVGPVRKKRLLTAFGSAAGTSARRSTRSPPLKG